MPRSSRHKSRRSAAKDAKEYSDVEDDVVVKGKQHRGEGKEEGGGGSSSRYRESGSGEKRKLASVSVTVKDAGGHGNEYSSDEYVGSKRRKEKLDRVGSDRWNGSGEASFGVESEVREESLHYDEKSVKSKSGSELKSKVGSTRYDVDKKEESFVGKEESRGGKEKEELKRKSERDRYDKERLDKESSRKDAYQQKDVQEKERRYERDDRHVDSKRDYRAEDSEEPKAKKASDAKDLALDDEYQKHDSEKERERRRRKRADEIGEDRYHQDRIRDNDDANLTSRRERDREGRDREDRHKDANIRDKHHEHIDRDNKGRETEKRDSSDKQRVKKNEDYRDDRASKDYPVKKSDSKYTRDETDALDSHHKKLRTDNYESGNKYDDQSSKYKDYKENRLSIDKDDYGDMRSRSVKERSELEKKSTGGREEAVSDRERSRAFHSEESTIGQSRRNRSPSSNVHATREQSRYPKQHENKYRETLPEERSRHNHTYSKEGNGSGLVDRTYSSRASDKSTHREESGYVGDFSSDRQRTTDRRVSPVHITEKSPSSLSAERKHFGRSGDRRSHDYEDSGPRNSGQKETNSQFYEGRRSQDVKREATPMDDASQADADNMSVSSSFTRPGRTSGNSRSLLPPPSPLKHGVDNSYPIGSSEEDGRGKPNNRPKRLGDSNMGRMQGNAWRGVWPSPMANGYMPFPHGPPAVGFHPMMQQFPPQIYGARPPLDHNGIPYHISDVDRFGGFGRSFGWPNPGDETCPSPMPNWDSTNMVPGENYTPGRLDWDQTRNLMGNASRETSVDRHKGGNPGMMESPSGNQRGAKDVVSAYDMNQGFNSESDRPDNQLINGNNVKLEANLSTDVSASFEEASKRAPSSEYQGGNKRSVDGDDSARLASVYLSRIDISADLTYSDLFDQCVSLVGRKQNIMFTTEVSGILLEEADAEGGESTVTYTDGSRTPFLAFIGDSLLEKAMSLYKQHRDETVAIRLPCLSDRNQFVPSSEIQVSEPVCTADRDHLEEEIGKFPASPGPLSEFPGLKIDEQTAGKSTSLPELEEAPSSTFSDKVVEGGDCDVLEEPVNHWTTSEDAKDMIPQLKREASTDDTVEKKTVETPSSILVVEGKNADTDMVDAETARSPNIDIINETGEATEAGSPPVDAPRTKKVETATGDQTTTLSSTSTNKNSTPCEGGGSGIMMAELNEFGSVNLSRIH